MTDVNSPPAETVLPSFFPHLRKNVSARRRSWCVAYKLAQAQAVVCTDNLARAYCVGENDGRIYEGRLRVRSSRPASCRGASPRRASAVVQAIAPDPASTSLVGRNARLHRQMRAHVRWLCASARARSLGAHLLFSFCRLLHARESEAEENRASSEYRTLSELGWTLDVAAPFSCATKEEIV